MSKYNWHPSSTHGNPVICERSGPYVFYYEDRKELVISEEGKHFDDHAVAVFEANSLMEAESIVDKLKDLRTQ